MDAARFDTLARDLASAVSRRGLALVLAGGALMRLDMVSAKKNKPKKSKLDDCGGCPAEQPVCCRDTHYPYGTRLSHGAADLLSIRVLSERPKHLLRRQ